MKKIAALAVALSAAFGAHAANPGISQVGTGPGTYTGHDQNTVVGGTTYDTSWYVVLGPGTYDLSGFVSSKNTKLTDVWFSFGPDSNSSGNNDIAVFTNEGRTADALNLWDLTTPVEITLTQQTKVFLNIDAKTAGKNFFGSFTVTAVPEPATSALMLAGVAALGFIGRRRRA